MRTRQHRIISHCPEETLSIGAIIGKYITDGLVVTLTGELGSGKTCLTQGIAEGLQVPQGFYVTSPSYSLINQYPGRLPLFHADLYRVKDLTELDDIGLDEILGTHGVTVIEWAEKLQARLPDERLDMLICIVDDQTRELYLTGHGHSAIEVVEKCIDHSRKINK